MRSFLIVVAFPYAGESLRFSKVREALGVQEFITQPRLEGFGLASRLGFRDLPFPKLCRCSYLHGMGSLHAHGAVEQFSHGKTQLVTVPLSLSVGFEVIPMHIYENT